MEASVINQPKKTIVVKDVKDKDIRKNKREINIFMPSMITKRVSLAMSNIGSNIKPLLEKIISSQIEGKCIVEGYIKPGTVKILTYSNGMLNSDNVIFEVVFECLVCSPVEGMLIDVVAKNITKAGIRAEYDTIPSPIEVFVARDHHYKSTYFASIKENDKIRIRVIGQRYELNDKYISIIAELIEPRQAKPIKKPRLILEN
jgi:DNA-directed RNA polymerase subunit E'/Rpb7